MSFASSEKDPGRPRSWMKRPRTSAFGVHTKGDETSAEFANLSHTARYGTCVRSAIRVHMASTRATAESAIQVRMARSIDFVVGAVAASMTGSSTNVKCVSLSKVARKGVLL